MRHELSSTEMQTAIAQSRNLNDANLPPGPYRVAIVGLETSRMYVCRWFDKTYIHLGAAREEAQHIREMGTEYSIATEGVRVIVADNPTREGVVSF